MMLSRCGEPFSNKSGADMHRKSAGVFALNATRVQGFQCLLRVISVVRGIPACPIRPESRHLANSWHPYSNAIMVLCRGLAPAKRTVSSVRQDTAPLLTLPMALVREW